MKKYATILFTLVISVGLLAQPSEKTPFSESEIILHTSSGDIYGTLVVPNSFKKSPLVLIIAGSGATDRDCNSPAGLNINAYKMLADSFVAKGVASLRFDKRGIGKSRAAMTQESDLRFDDYVDDVVAWISMIKTDKRFSEIVIVGHSEGSLIGMVAAQKVEIDGFVSISGAGKSADRIIEEQLSTKLPQILLDESNNILDSLRAGKTVDKVNPFLLSLYRPSVQPYMISWMKYDPAMEIAKLTIPAMIIQGTTDLQVTTSDAELLSKANPAAKLLIIENMNHVLKEADADIPRNMSTYQNPELPIKKGLVQEIVGYFFKGYMVKKQKVKR